MPQTAPGFAPFLPTRPDPEAEFLKALGRRDAHTCQRLLLQLVHRRGVGALQNLRHRSLALEPEQQGWIWLDQVLAAEPIAAAALHSPPEQAVSEPNQPGEEMVSVDPAPPELAARAVAVGPATTQDLALAVGSEVDPGVAEALGALASSGTAGASAPAVGAGKPDQVSEILTSAQLPERQLVAVPQAPLGRPILDLRAEAAVDAAFEALAAEFPVYGQPGELADHPLAADQEPPADLIGDLSLDLDGDLQPQRPFSFVIPRPPEQAPLEGESAGQLLDSSDRPREAQELAAEPQGDDVWHQQVAGFWGRAEGRLAGLGDRLRSRFSLTRVKTLVRDCVEEAVSSLQGPNPVAESQLQVSLEQVNPATTIAGTTGARGNLAVASGASAFALPWSQAQPDDTFASDLAAPLHQAPEAAFGPRFATDTRSPKPTAAEPQARLSTTQQLRQRLLGRRPGETRPAPAPQALSDLRAWLAADDDLPRAS